MSEFDHLWECAVKMHKASTTDFNLLGLGSTPNRPTEYC